SDARRLIKEPLQTNNLIAYPTKSPIQPVSPHERMVIPSPPHAGLDRRRGNITGQTELSIGPGRKHPSAIWRFDSPGSGSMRFYYKTPLLTPRSPRPEAMSSGPASPIIAASTTNPSMTARRALATLSGDAPFSRSPASFHRTA